jgi:MFS family permease
VILAGRALRSFAFGWLSVILALYLSARGFSAAQIGAIFTATMVEDAVLTILLSSVAARLGPAVVMAATAPLMVLGGALLAFAPSMAWLAVGAVLGTISPNGQEAGPFAPMEQSLLPGTVRRGTVVRALGWYNLCAFLPAAVGAGAAGFVLAECLRRGVAEADAERAMVLVYAGLGLVITLLSVFLADRLRRQRVALAPPLGFLGLHRSRKAVLELAGLQAIDALGGGFVIQSLLAYWFRIRFGAGPEALGALFFGTSLLSALSALLATRVAERAGLLNTMVFTHLPSNLLLMLVPFMPSFPAAAGVLLARHVLSQMDVPTRQAFTIALVTPEERPAAAGLTASVRALAQACAPVVAGVSMAVAATPLPFLLGGGLKTFYDLLLFFRFRNVALASADGASADQATGRATNGGASRRAPS